MTTRASVTSPADPSTTQRAALMKADPVLGRHMERVGPYALKTDGTSDLYQALAESIVYQQLHGKAAATIFGRLRALGKNGFPTPEEMLSFDDATLRGVGLSGAKTRAVQDLAAKQRAGALPTIEEAHGLDNEALVQALTSVRGIGPWSVEMLLMFRLGRGDVLPATDYGVRQGFMKVFRTRTLPTPQEVLRRGERWRPHRSMAAWYLWRALDAKSPSTAQNAATKKVPKKKAPKKRAPKNGAPKKKAPKNGAPKNGASTKKAPVTTRRRPSPR